MKKSLLDMCSPKTPTTSSISSVSSKTPRKLDSYFEERQTNLRDQLIASNHFMARQFSNDILIGKLKSVNNMMEDLLHNGKIQENTIAINDRLLLLDMVESTLKSKIKSPTHHNQQQKQKIDQISKQERIKKLKQKYCLIKHQQVQSNKSLSNKNISFRCSYSKSQIFSQQVITLKNEIPRLDSSKFISGAKLSYSDNHLRQTDKSK